jgi:hypothetical protein
MSFDLKITNGDLSIGSDGDISVVIGNQKIFQEIKKIVLTDVGENKFHPYYGSRAGSLSVGSIVDYDFISSELKRSVSESITNLIRLKDSQSRYQNLNPSEVILTLDSVDVERDGVDPRVWSIYISVTTQSLDDVNTVINIRM